MPVSDIKLYNLLRAKVGEEQAQTLVEFIQNSVREEFDTKKEIFATKEDLANAKTDIIKWMFIFWVGQLASFIAIAKFIFHQ